MFRNLFRMPLMQQAGLQYVWPLDEDGTTDPIAVRRCYSPPWAAVPPAHMVPVNGPTQTTGLFGPGPYATLFASASSQYVVTPSQSSISSGPRDMWVSLWLKINTSQTQVVAAKVYEWSILPTASNTIFSIYNFNGSSQETVGTGSALNTTGWHHILGWCDSASKTIGISVDGASPVVAAMTIARTAGSQSIRIGCFDGTTYFYDGKVQQLCLGFPTQPIGTFITQLSRTLYTNGVGFDLVRRLPVVNPVQTTYASDDFSEADGTNLSGKSTDTSQTWTVHNGTWETNSGNIRQTTTTGTYHRASFDCGQYDYVVTVPYTEASGIRLYGALVRLTDTSNNWMIYLSYSGGAILYEWVAGSPTNRGSVGWSALTPGNTYTIKVVCAGASISCTVYSGSTILGVIAYHAMSTCLTSTKVGLFDYRDGTYVGQPLFNDITVKSL